MLQPALTLPSSWLGHLHSQVRANAWLRYFAVFNRVALAVGFLLAGGVKIMGERFASGLSANHPMGHYLEALSHTGYYYPFLGVMQVLAAALLLVPRTATLGALLYFPIIVNICVLSLAVRFEGSLLTSPLMVLANLYLLCWDYHKLRYLFCAGSLAPTGPAPSKRFPMKFFAASAVAVVAVALLPRLCQVMPRNSLADCRRQFAGTRRTTAGYQFCSCIHQQGNPLSESLDKYDRTPDDEAISK